MLGISQLTKNQNGVPLYQNVSFQINPGEKIGLVGPNGSGKTTLFRIITKEEQPDSGSVSLQNGMRLSYFSQNVGAMAGRSALNEVIEGDSNISKMKKLLAQCEEKLSNPDLSDEEMNQTLEIMGETQIEFEKVGGYDLDSVASEILTGLGIPPNDHHRPVEDFSGGWKMRIALAKSLVTRPDIILMDEPTNYLDMETILWLEQWLKEFKGAILLTTHDRTFMNNIVKKIIEISNRNITMYTGNYDFYENEKKVRLEKLKSSASRQQDMLAKEEEFIAKFKARASHAAQVQSRVKKLEKIERIEIPQEQEEISFCWSPPPRGGDEVVNISNLSKHYEDSQKNIKIIFENLTTTIMRQEKIAIVGVNGAGKSTLLKCIAHIHDPSSGNVQLGPSIKLGYFGQFSYQMQENLLNNTLQEYMQSQLGHMSDGAIRNLLAAFLFKGDEVYKKLRHLSGGERSRLLLAILFSQNNNLLILDEPTNHLDLRSREILLDALKKYEGTLLFVSHDRYFLQQLAIKVLEVSNNKISIFPGNYDYYLSTKNSFNVS